MLTNGSGSARGHVADARLVELGLSVRVSAASVQGGITTLSLEAGGGKAAVVDAQVFDAEGRPWPTVLAPADPAGPERAWQLLVAGKPRPPFSLGLELGGAGPVVVVPIVVEKAPVASTPGTSPRAEPAGRRRAESLAAKQPAQAARPPAGPDADLPILDAGPGFTAEPVNLTITFTRRDLAQGGEPARTRSQ